MLQAVEFREERCELQTLLDSGIFDRAPHLSSFLKYVCEKYFDGRADELKEYTIGVDALKRPQGFDPKKDSIVRVEAHRLRNIGHGSSFVPASPKDQHRSLERVFIEADRSSRLSFSGFHSLFATAYIRAQNSESDARPLHL